MCPYLRSIAVFSLCVVALSGCFKEKSKSDPAAGKALTTSDVVAGMSLTDFSHIYRRARVQSTGQWMRPDEIHGLRGEWTYSFYKGRLSWFVFNSYDPEVNAKTFKEYLDATRKAVASYTERYGKPASVTSGVLEFKNPAEGYPGYPVLRVSWTTRSESIQVAYSVLGNTR